MCGDTEDHEIACRPSTVKVVFTVESTDFFCCSTLSDENLNMPMRLPLQLPGHSSVMATVCPSGETAIPHGLLRPDTIDCVLPFRVDAKRTRPLEVHFDPQICISQRVGSTTNPGTCKYTNWPESGVSQFTVNGDPSDGRCGWFCTHRLLRVSSVGP